MKDSSIILYNELFIRYPQLKSCREPLLHAIEKLISCFSNDRKLLICGNGGSAADAAHIVGELMKSFMLRRPVKDVFREKLLEMYPEYAAKIADNLQGALPAIALTQENALLSAFANDVDPELVYAQQVYGYGKKGDVLLCISTSGNSQNIVSAAVVAKAKELFTIALTGENNSRLSALCDLSIQVPGTEPYKIQELHLPLYHCLCAILEQEFFET